MGDYGTAWGMAQSFVMSRGSDPPRGQFIAGLQACELEDSEVDALVGQVWSSPADQAAKSLTVAAIKAAYPG